MEARNVGRRPVEGEEDRGRDDAETIRRAQRALSRLGAQGVRETGTVDRWTAGALSQLAPGGRGDAVRAVQTMLESVGYGLPVHGADGAYEEETTESVVRFQRDLGIAATGRVDVETLAALDRLAPPPGEARARFPEYDRLYADGRVDVTIAHGYYDEGRDLQDRSIARLRRGLLDQGFMPVDPGRLDGSQRARLGLGPDRVVAGASYLHRRVPGPAGEGADVVIALLTPGSAPTPEGVRDAFARALGRDEVVAYVGHARYGTGPDFDPIDSARGNFVIDRSGGPTGNPHPPLSTALAAGPRTMLGAVGLPEGGYQLLYFNACTTSNYLPALRERFGGRDADNTDVVGTTIPMRIATGPEHVLAFTAMLADRSSVSALVTEAGRRESAFVESLAARGIPIESLPPDAARRVHRPLFESGFADNDE
jgi:hypothetical protein